MIPTASCKGWPLSCCETAETGGWQVKPAGRLLFPHCIVQNVVVSAATHTLSVSLLKQITVRLTATKEIAMLEIIGEAVA